MEEDFVDAAALDPPAEVLRALPVDVAHQLCALPIAIEGKTLVLAVEDPADFERFERLQFVANREVRLVAAPRVPLLFAIWRHYGPPGEGR
jgi:general secretion pathway protein E/type IV pilus assembly protein PilB